MHQLGHVGAALLLYSPVAFRYLSAGETALAILGGAIAVSLATAPDCDEYLPFVEHRSVTHTVVFALLVGATIGAAAWVVGSRVDPTIAGSVARFAFGVGTLTVVSHLLADVVTPMGIRPFWPVSDRHFTLGLVYSKNWTANVLLFAVGAAATVLVALVTANA